MEQQWIKELRGDGLIEPTLAFGPESDELRAARDGAVVSPLLDFGLIRVSGPDAPTFLHNLLTNDVSGLIGTSARFAGICSPKGRLLATMHVLKIEGQLLLLAPLDLLDGLLKRLSMYVLRSKVSLADAREEFALVGTSKFGAIEGIDLASNPFTGASFQGGHVFRLDSERTVFVIPVDSAKSLWDRLRRVGFAVGTTAWRWLEIRAGQPRVVQATQELFVPQMLNMENVAVGGVSFTKGCYPGQEIVARTQYLGKIKRRMYLTHFMDLPEAGPGSPIFSIETGAQQCGSVVSIANSPDGGKDALICVQSSAAESGEINLGSPDGPRPKIEKLPYLVEPGDA